MMFHLFIKMHSRQWAATDDRNSWKLPSPNQWTYCKTVSESRIGFDAAEAAATILKQGYYLFTVGILVTEKQEII